MSQYSLNGVELHIPLAPETPFSELVDYFKKNFNSDSTLISTILVNGTEINPQDEDELASIPLGQLKKIEIFTSHPKEVAHDTLQDLLKFTNNLEGQSRVISSAFESKNFLSLLTQLIDGISVFTEGIYNAKRILQIDTLLEADEAEADLLSILKELLNCQQNGYKARMKELLGQHLPRCFQKWRDSGIPAIIRSRDS